MYEKNDDIEGRDGISKCNCSMTADESPLFHCRADEPWDAHQLGTQWSNIGGGPSSILISEAGSVNRKL